MIQYKDIKKFVDSKMVFVGMDIHKKHWHLAFYCDGEYVEIVRIRSDYLQLLHVLSKYSTARGISLVYEAGFCGFWLYRRLKAHGYSCMITPPTSVPKSTSKVKTDKRDCRKLASYLASHILKSVYVPPQEVEADRRIFRRRMDLVNQAKASKNKIKSFLNLHQIDRPEHIKKNWSKPYIAWLKSLSWQYGSDTFFFNNLLKIYLRQREDLAEVTKQLRYLSRSDAYHSSYQRVTTCRGVGLITGMMFLLELYDMVRFKRSDQLASYLGLTPCQFSSGEEVHMGHITRQGNHRARAMLVESAWTVIRYDPHLRDKYERIRAKGNNGKKAIVAVAHSLAIRLRRCLLDQTDYVIGVC
jgi:transposase